MSDRKRRASFLFEVVAAISLVIMVILVGAQVLFRYVLDSPLSWSEEMARAAFVYLTFSGAAAAVARRQNMRAEFLLSMLPPKARIVGTALITCITLGFLLVVVYQSIPMLIRFHTVAPRTPALDWPMSVIYAPLPVGLLGMAAFFIWNAWEDLAEINRATTKKVAPDSAPAAELAREEGR